MNGAVNNMMITIVEDTVSVKKLGTIKNGSI